MGLKSEFYFWHKSCCSLEARRALVAVAFLPVHDLRFVMHRSISTASPHVGLGKLPSYLCCSFCNHYLRWPNICCLLLIYRQRWEIILPVFLLQPLGIVCKRKLNGGIWYLKLFLACFSSLSTDICFCIVFSTALFNTAFNTVVYAAISAMSTMQKRFPTSVGLTCLNTG